MVTEGAALNVAVELADSPAASVTGLGLKDIVRPEGTLTPVEREMGPEKPLRLVRVRVSVLVEPEAKERFVRLRVNPKSFTTTLIVIELSRVSGFPDWSNVLYVPNIVTA